MDASYLGDVFTRVVKLTSRWSSEQARCEAMLVALAEFHGRLAHLADDGSASATPSTSVLGADGHALLRARHVRGVENLMEALQSSWKKFETVQGELSDLHASLWQRHETLLKEHHKASSSSEASQSSAAAFEQPTWSIVGAGRGLDAQPVGLPPVTECIDNVRDLDAQYAAELLLKFELLESIDVTMPADALQGVVRLWNLQPNLTPLALQRAVSLTQSLTLPT